MRKVIITGGLGFIGSNFVKHWLKNHPEDQVLCLDACTYAARPAYLSDVWENPNFKVIRGDIRNRGTINTLFEMFQPDHIFHFAAESHVCNSIEGPEIFMQTNVLGTFNLLEEFRLYQEKHKKQGRFVHISTDEVFGELPPNPEIKFNEETPIAPRSPYSSSKASSDLVALAYVHTYGMNVVVTNCSNNYGPNQHEEKLIPKVIHRIMQKKPVDVYGKGDHIRDWIYVEDHCKAVEEVFWRGQRGERYCIGGETELTNMEVIFKVHQKLQDFLGETVILDMVHNNLRPTDDFRYAIDNTKMREKIGWEPSKTFEQHLETTVKWYLKEAFGVEK